MDRLISTKGVFQHTHEEIKVKPTYYSRYKTLVAGSSIRIMISITRFNYADFKYNIFKSANSNTIHL